MACLFYWGKAWCENLERYVDYESRLERGKRYVRTGAVVDLQIQKGKTAPEYRGAERCPIKQRSESARFRKNAARI